jgi:succinate dehydrogenase / fumarate reductase flavoprotein subunit
VFGKRAGEYAAAFARENRAGRIDETRVEAAAAEALAPFERENSGENPFTIQHELQDKMQALVGIVRNASDMQEALIVIAHLSERAIHVGVGGNREYNPGWHTALDLHNLLTVSEAVTLAALERKESRGAHFREDFPDKDEELGKLSIVLRKNEDGGMDVIPQPIQPMREDLAQIIAENR